VARRHDRLVDVKNLQAYLFAMARNEAVTLMRRQARRAEPPRPDDLWLVSMAPDTAQEDNGDAVRRALSDLPEQQRTVVVLKIYEDMTFQQIADALGISINTAASRYRYAMDKLRGLLKDESR
jgi:RNA polymerase sigma-70 factor, ECF subfamily